MKLGYNNFISFKSSGVHFKIIRDLKEVGDIMSLSGGYMVEIPSIKIEDKYFKTLGQAKSFVFNTLNKKVI